MRSLWLLAALSSFVHADTALSQTELETLTPIDTVPTQPQLDSLFGGVAKNTEDGLTKIVQDNTTDPGVRLRAIHALSKYCLLQVGTPPNTTCDPSDEAHLALVALITATASASQGTDTLALRAAIEAVGPMRVPNDINQLVPLLDHPSRDIRTATAHALRDLCNTQAINPLRVRYQHEPTDQVKLAISEALRILPCPATQ